MQSCRNSKSVRQSQFGSSERPRCSEIILADEPEQTPAKKLRAEDRLLPRKHRSQFDFLPLGELELQDPFCQGLRLVLNYPRRFEHSMLPEIPESLEMRTIKLRMVPEITKRGFENIIERSFELSSLNKPIGYFQNRQISWLGSGAQFTSYECTKARKEVPAIFYWNDAVVYQNGTYKSYRETPYDDISAVEFHLPHVYMVGQQEGTMHLVDFERGITYRSLATGPAGYWRSYACPITDLSTYYHRGHSNLVLALSGSILKGIDLSQKSAIFCEFDPKDQAFFPKKAKVLDDIKVAVHGTESNQIILWDLRNPAKPYASPTFSMEIDLLDYNPDDSAQVIFSSYRSIYLYNFLTESIQDSVSFPGLVTGLTWHTSGEISVVHSEYHTGLSLLRVNQKGKLQLQEEIRTNEPHGDSNVFSVEGCKHNNQVLMLGDVNLHSPNNSVPNYAVMRF